MVPATAFEEDRGLANPSGQHEEIGHGDAKDVEDSVQLRQLRPFLGLVPELPRGWGLLLLLRCLLFWGTATSLFECRRDAVMRVSGRGQARTVSSNTKSKSYLSGAALVAGLRSHDDAAGRGASLGSACAEKERG
jgi:hypothetical protein